MMKRKPLQFCLEHVAGSRVSEMAQQLLEITRKINDAMICGQHVEPLWAHSSSLYASSITTNIWIQVRSLYLR